MFWQRKVLYYDNENDNEKYFILALTKQQILLYS